MSPWGPDDATLLIVGLAPGAKGANRTGLPFWGDASGNFLMDALIELGVAEPNTEHPRLLSVRIANAVACLPPKNRPSPSEIKQCGTEWLKIELARFPYRVCLGKVAHESVRRLIGLSPKEMPFSHGGLTTLDRGFVLSSYHPSPLNTQTGRLNQAEFNALIRRALFMAERTLLG